MKEQVNDFVKHLFGRSRQRVTQEVKAGGDSQWRPRFLSQGWDLDDSAAAGFRTDETVGE
jgi:hypothetical protein